MDEQRAMNIFRQELNEKYEKKRELFNVMLRTKGLSNLYLFNKYILEVEKGDEQFVPLGKFHRNMCNFVSDRSDRKKLLLIPRSHLKTKLITIGRSVQRIIQKPDIRILLYSATWQIATDIHMNVQKVLKTNEKILELFGDLTQGATAWSADHTRLRGNNKKEATITAAGIDNNLVSGHYDLIIMDDVVNRDNVNTADQIEKVKTRYRDALDLLEPHGELVIIGTRWHDMDLYGWILDPSNDLLGSFDILVMKAFEGNLVTGEGFEPLWPGKFSEDKFRELLRNEGWYHFASQYLNDPVPEDDAVFKRVWIKYWDSDLIRGKKLTKFLAIDPALSNAKDADYTGMVVMGIDEYGDIYLLDIVRAHLSPNQILEEIFRLRERWELTDVGIEMVAFQKALAYSLREDMRFKKRPFHITELKPNERTKDQRIKGLQPLYENGKIYHDKTLLNNMYLEDELIRFPRSTHDDIIDAFAYCLDFIYPPRKLSSNKTARRYLY